MGNIVCPKHGDQGFYDCCEHVHFAIQNNEPIQTHYIEILNLQVCTDCYERLSFYEVDGYKFDEVMKLAKREFTPVEKMAFEKYDQLDRRAVCERCFKEVNNSPD